MVGGFSVCGNCETGIIPLWLTAVFLDNAQDLLPGLFFFPLRGKWQWRKNTSPYSFPPRWMTRHMSTLDSKGEVTSCWFCSISWSEASTMDGGKNSKSVSCFCCKLSCPHPPNISVTLCPKDYNPKLQPGTIFMTKHRKSGSSGFLLQRPNIIDKLSSSLLTLHQPHVTDVN